MAGLSPPLDERGAERDAQIAHQSPQPQDGGQSQCSPQPQLGPQQQRLSATGALLAGALALAQPHLRAGQGLQEHWLLVALDIVVLPSWRRVAALEEADAPARSGLHPGELHPAAWASDGP